MTTNRKRGLCPLYRLGEPYPIQRGLPRQAPYLYPFITGGFSRRARLYYEVNALSNNMILCDRKQIKKPQRLNLGVRRGSGKSLPPNGNDKRFLITDDDIIICDPEAEYFSLCSGLTGQVIRLSPTGKGIDGSPVCEPYG